MMLAALRWLRKLVAVEGERTEEELRRSGQRYALVMEASEEGFWDWIVAADHFYASPRLLEMYGFPPGTIFAGREDLLARFPVHPDDRQKWQEAIAAHFAGRTVRFDMELRILRGGETRWLHLTGLATRNDTGEVVRWTGTTKDVTARKRVEEALRVSEERFALAVVGAKDGIWDRDLTTGMHYLSPRAQEISMGRLSDGVDVRHESEWAQWFHIHPDDAARREVATRDHLKGHTPRYEGEWRVRHQDGSYHWIHARGICTRDASGRAVRLAGSTTDIDARKRTEEALRISEERYALAMEAAQDGHWDWIVGTGEYYVSPRDLQLYGLPADTTFGSRGDFLARLPLVPEDRDAWLRAVADLFAGIGSRLSMELRANVHGETRWIQFSGVCLRDASGKPVRWSGTSRDVTDRKRAEDALRISEERYARAMEGSDAGLWEWNPVTDAAFASPRAHRLFGIPDGVEIHSRDDLKAHAGFHPEDRQRIEDAIRACLERRTEGFEAEYRVINPAGETRWVRSRGKVFADAQGRPALISGSVTDIDARKLTEQELKRSEERYALVMAAADEGYWDWVVATDQFQASPRLLKMYGLPPDTTFAGRDDFLARIPLHPEDRPKWQKAVAAHFAGKTARLEMENRLLWGGETRWIHITGLATRDAAGSVVRWTGATRDVTARRLAEEERRLSEERYALAMQASGEGHWDWKIATDEYYTSPRHLEIAGFPPGTKFSGRAEVVARVPFHPEDRPGYDAAVAAHFAGKTPRVDIEMRLVRPGELRWVHLIGMCLRDAAGVPVRWAGSVTDITEQKRAEEELKRLEWQLRQAQRLEAVGTLAGGVAHDFNNILGAILGYGEMALRDAPPGSRLRRDVESILTAGERGRTLVERILAFSRSGVGERVAVHVEAVVREALELLSAHLPDNVRIESDLRAGRAAMLGDPTQVHQVLMNLATNGIQAMSDSGGALRVSLEALRLDAPHLATTGRAPAGDWIVLKIIDAGVGIAPNIMERIFDPFFTTKEVGVGTGLGLSLVHGIVSELGGAVDVASTVGIGSTFTVYLPRSGEAVESAEVEAPAVPRGDRQRVLVVDDEEPLVRLATRTLEELGYEPVGFTSSVAALAAFRADPDRFDALVTDERMPGMSGATLIREVRGIRRAIPIVLVSGYVGKEVARRAYNAGADEVLKKPLSARELATSLARVLPAL
jgi:PAS domain S-box-containing protein